MIQILRIKKGIVIINEGVLFPPCGREVFGSRLDALRAGHLHWVHVVEVQSRHQEEHFPAGEQALQIPNGINPKLLPSYTKRDNINSLEYQFFFY